MGQKKANGRLYSDQHRRKEGKNGMREGDMIKIKKLSSSENHINISSYSCNSKDVAPSDEVIPMVILSKERKQSVPEKMVSISTKSPGLI